MVKLTKGANTDAHLLLAFDLYATFVQCAASEEITQPFHFH